METMRDIQLRIKSVKSTRQITESMRMISTRKVQKLKARSESNKPYYQGSVKIIQNMASDTQFYRHRFIAENEGGRALIILITADRGLCGGYNANAIKEAHNLAKRFEDPHLITVGTKGTDYFRRKKVSLEKFYKGLSENPRFEDAQAIYDVVSDMCDKGAVDQVWLVYTKYLSMMSQVPTAVRLLPLDNEFIHYKKEREAGETPDPSMNYDSLDLPAEGVLDFAIGTYATSVIFSAMLESGVCEQCSRMMGMDSAVRNSDKIIDTLTLNYNQMRQGAITQEIAEIVSGTNAVSK